MRTPICRLTDSELVYKLVTILGKSVRYGLRKAIELGLGQAASKSRILDNDRHVWEVGYYACLRAPVLYLRVSQTLQGAPKQYSPS